MSYLIVLDIHDTISRRYQNKWIALPGIESLLKNRKIKFVLWSSCLRRNLDLFIKQNKIPSYIDSYDVSYCEADPIQPECATYTHTIKPLKVIWDIYKEYNETNTIIIDDTMMKTRFNKDNAVILSEVPLMERVNYIKSIIDNICNKEIDVREYLVQMKNIK